MDARKKNEKSIKQWHKAEVMEVDEANQKITVRYTQEPSILEVELPFDSEDVCKAYTHIKKDIKKAKSKKE